MAHELVLLSPEKTVLTFRLSGLGSRIQAHLMDLLIFALLLLMLFWTLSLMSSSVINPLWIGPIMKLAAGLGFFLYFVAFEAFWNGQTLGKKAAGIRVRMADGTPITFGAALGRNLLRPADFLPGMYFVGLLAIFTNLKSQRIGDLVAGTIVVHDRAPKARFAPSPHTVAIHPYEPHVGELRGMTPNEYVALKQMCDRFPELPPHVQTRFLREVWEPIAKRRGVPDLPSVHPIFLAEAVVMRYGRTHGLL